MSMNAPERKRQADRRHSNAAVCSAAVQSFACDSSPMTVWLIQFTLFASRYEICRRWISDADTELTTSVVEAV
jgi:hypothetical protein